MSLPLKIIGPDGSCLEVDVMQPLVDLIAKFRANRSIEKKEQFLSILDFMKHNRSSLGQTALNFFHAAGHGSIASDIPLLVTHDL